MKFDTKSVMNVIFSVVSRASLILPQVLLMDKCTLASKFSITSVKAISHTFFPFNLNTKLSGCTFFCPFDFLACATTWAHEDRRLNCTWHFLFTTVDLAGHENTHVICKDEFLYFYVTILSSSVPLLLCIESQMKFVKTSFHHLLLLF